MVNENTSEYDQLVRVVQDWASRFDWDEEKTSTIEAEAVSTVLDIVEYFLNPADSPYFQEISETILDDPEVEATILRDLVLDIYRSIVSSRTSYHFIDAKPYLGEDEEIVAEFIDDIPTYWDGDDPHNIH